MLAAYTPVHTAKTETTLQHNPYHPSASTLSAADDEAGRADPPSSTDTPPLTAAPPRWFIRTLIVLGIGGGTLGLVVIALIAVNTAPGLTYVLFLPVIAAYAFGIYCGVAALRRSPRYLARNAVFYWLQVPVLSSPALVFAFTAGAQVVVGIAPPSRLLWNFYLGSTFQLFVVGEAPVAIGVNLVAVAMLFLIYRFKARATAASSEPRR